MENGYIESFDGRLRDECLNVNAFFSLEEAREKLEQWWEDYNLARLHSAPADQHRQRSRRHGRNPQVPPKHARCLRHLVELH